MNKLVANAFSLFSAKVVLLLASLALAAILSRRLGPAGYGDFRSLLSLCALLGLALELGMDKIAIRESSAAPPRTPLWVGTALSLKSLFALSVALCALVFLPRLVPGRRPLPLVFLGLGIYAVTGLANTLTVVFRSRERMGLEALSKTAKSLFLLALVFLLARSVASAAWVYFVSALFQLALSWELVRRLFFPPVFRWEGAASRRLIRGGALLALAVFFNSFQDVVRLIVYGKSGAAAAGYYSAGSSFFQALEGLVPLSLAGALFPLVCRLRSSDRDAVARIYRRSRGYLYLLALPFATASVLLAPRLCAFFFGGSFAEASGVVRALGVASLPMVQNYLLFDLMVASGREALFAATMGAGALLNAGAAYLLAGPFGPAGAAAGSALAQLFLFLLFLRLLKDELPAAAPLSLLRPLPAAAALGLVLWGLNRCGWPLPLVVSAALLVYGLGLAASGALTREDWALLRSGLSGGTGSSPG